jgi:hypothetical protein
MYQKAILARGAKAGCNVLASGDDEDERRNILIREVSFG